MALAMAMAMALALLGSDSRMTTQKIKACEFVAGLCSTCGASEQLGCEGWVVPDTTHDDYHADVIARFAEKVEALTKERDALDAARKEYQIELLAAATERDELKAAAKLALDSLEIAQNNLASSRAMLGGYTYLWDKHSAAIEALRKALK